MKKILIFGKNGQVAWELQRSCAILGQVYACASDEVSLENIDQVTRAIRDYQPDCIINAAAYTAVDRAESDEEKANTINGYTVGVMADEAKKIGARFVHYSTDYVYDGIKREPYVETDTPNPINAYGRSKLIGDKLVEEVDGDYVILRVSWVYGNRGNNFFRTMLRLGLVKEELSIVDDQFGAPTWSRHIADLTSIILSHNDFSERRGVYNVSPRGETTWFGFAQEIFDQSKNIMNCDLVVKRIVPIKSIDYPTPAKRPQNSRMSSKKLLDTFGVVVPEWQSSLALLIKDIK